MPRKESLAVAVVLGLFLSLTFGLGLVLADGGAPPTHPRPGVTEFGPQVLSWRLVSAGARGGGTLLCDHATPCAPPAERAAEAAVCAFEMGVWASGNENAPLLRDVDVLVYGIATRGDGVPRPDGRINFSSFTTQVHLGVVDDLWWKGERHELRGMMPVPCDATRVKMSFNFHGHQVVPSGEDSWAETATVWPTKGSFQRFPGSS